MFACLLVCLFVCWFVLFLFVLFVCLFVLFVCLFVCLLLALVSLVGRLVLAGLFCFSYFCLLGCFVLVTFVCWVASFAQLLFVCSFVLGLFVCLLIRSLVPSEAWLEQTSGRRCRSLVGRLVGGMVN